MTYTILGRDVSVTSTKDLCGFWRSFALTEISSEKFGASSEEFLCDREASVKDALAKLESHIRDHANGVMVRFYEEWLSTQRRRQEVARGFITNVVPESL